MTFEHFGFSILPVLKSTSRELLWSDDDVKLWKIGIFCDFANIYCSRKYPQQRELMSSLETRWDIICTMLQKIRLSTTSWSVQLTSCFLVSTNAVWYILCRDIFKIVSKRFSVNSTDASVLTSTKRSCQEEARDIYLSVTLECWTSTRIYELSEEIKIPLWSKVRIGLVWDFFGINVLTNFDYV